MVSTSATPAKTQQTRINHSKEEEETNRIEKGDGIMLEFQAKLNLQCQMRWDEGLERGWS